MPAATKHAPIVSLMGVGSGNTINAIPIFTSLDLLPSRHSFLVASASRLVLFIAPNRSTQLSFNSFKALVAVFTSSVFIGRPFFFHIVLLEEKNFGILNDVAPQFFSSKSTIWKKKG